MSEAILKNMQAHLAPLRQLDWDDLERAYLATSHVLRSIAKERALFAALVRSLAQNPNLLRKCEKDINIQKYLLYSDPHDGFRLRLHVMHSSEKMILHSHRMDFASLILKGAYRHTLYGPPDDGSVLFGENQIFVTNVRMEREGNPYYISNRIIHNLVVEEGECISLMLRSPHRKQRALHCEAGTGRTWWRYGSDARTEESLTYSEQASMMDVKQLIAKLESQGLI